MAMWVVMFSAGSQGTIKSISLRNGLKTTRASNVPETLKAT